ncbi:hypothetical protein HYX12_01210 [Candidatus Woesearchaeota archaeon]|nr:hypothetical protein [Candidatus Woesearchaeota archaeon]
MKKRKSRLALMVMVMVMVMVVGGTKFSGFCYKNNADSSTSWTRCQLDDAGTWNDLDDPSNDLTLGYSPYNTAPNHLYVAPASRAAGYTGPLQTPTEAGSPGYQGDFESVGLTFATGPTLAIADTVAETAVTQIGTCSTCGTLTNIFDPSNEYIQALEQSTSLENQITSFNAYQGKTMTQDQLVAAGIIDSSPPGRFTAAVDLTDGADAGEMAIIGRSLQVEKEESDLLLELRREEYAKTLSTDSKSTRDTLSNEQRQARVDQMDVWQERLKNIDPEITSATDNYQKYTRTITSLPPTVEDSNYQKIKAQMLQEIKDGGFTTTTTIDDKSNKLAVEAQFAAFKAHLTNKQKEAKEKADKLRTEKAATKLALDNTYIETVGTVSLGESFGYTLKFITETPRFPTISNALFKGWEGLQDFRRDAEQKFFHYLKVDQQIEAAACEAYFDVTPQNGGTAMIEVSPGQYQFVGSIQAEKSAEADYFLSCSEGDDENPPQPCKKLNSVQLQCRDGLCYQNEDDETPEKGFLHKITWAVTAPTDISFTINTDENRREIDFNLCVGSDENDCANHFLFSYPNVGRGDANTLHLGAGNNSRMLDIPSLILDIIPTEQTTTCIKFGSNKPAGLRDWGSGGGIPDAVEEICTNFKTITKGKVDFENGITSSGAPAGVSRAGEFCGMEGC